MSKTFAIIKNGIEKVNSHINMNRVASSALAVSAVACTAVCAFAAEGDPLPTIAITSDMLTPLVQGVVSNIGVILPFGIGLFGIFLGIRLIPGLISRFVKL